MKTLYLDCGMGAAGDMLTAALTELLPDADAFITELNSAGVPGVVIEKELSVKCGITGTHISVKINGEEEHSNAHHHEEEHSHEHHHEEEHSHEHEHTHAHHHSSMHEIEHIIGHLKVSDKVKKDVTAVYNLIAEAESNAHGIPVTDIHFHEVGTMDAIADVTAVCLLMERLAPERVIASPVHVGSGQVKCAHGILPVPAPATAFILKDVPIYGGKITGELCTPTGAALLKYFVDIFGDMPVMKTEKIGYGMGQKDFIAANCVRAFLGETENAGDVIAELSCNIDDMTGEKIGFCMDRLFEAGAKDVFTVPIGMKKSRPGVLLKVLCAEQDRETVVNTIFKYTTTIGIREALCKRFTLERSVKMLDTAAGQVRQKISSGYGVTKIKYEYDDLIRIAEERKISVDEVISLIENSPITK